MDTKASDIVDRFGGLEVVCKRFKLGQKAVEQWEKRGLPRTRHMDFLDWAEELGVELSKAELKAASRRPSTQTNAG